MVNILLINIVSHNGLVVMMLRDNSALVGAEILKKEAECKDKPHVATVA